MAATCCAIISLDGGQWETVERVRRSVRSPLEGRTSQLRPA
ncbi:MAG TPA: hypothetical protein VHX15_10730 [Frankiaceae bacterium]|nr:hypothetical protein [Frankiaceae bacterium]